MIVPTLLRLTLGVLACLAIGLARAEGASPATMRVVYPGDDFRYAEYIALLRGALDETVRDFGPYEMHPASVQMNEPRFMLEAESGRLVNVVWGATSSEREARLHPIRIPLGKGILGYRILFIRDAMQPQFDRVRTLDDLRRFRFCLGPGWGDVPVYLHAGLHVDLAEYAQLLEMVQAGRCDVFSRGINEIFDEAGRKSPRLDHVAIERGLLLHYRYPFYLFVSPHEDHLATRIETGLRRMLADGRYERIFAEHNGEWIRLANTAGRRTIELENPELPAATPVGDARLWFQPAAAATHPRP